MSSTTTAPPTSRGALAAGAPRPALRRPSALRMTRVELRKMTDTRAGFWLLAITGLLIVGLVVLILLAAPAEESDHGGLFEAALWPPAVLLPVLGILSVTSEWSQRTALTTFALLPWREKVAGAKIAAGLLLAAAALVVAVVAATAGALVDGQELDLGLRAIALGGLFAGLNVLMGLAFGLAIMASAPAIVGFFVLPTAMAILTEVIRPLRDIAAWIDTSRTMDLLSQDAMASGDWAKLATSCALWIGLPLLFGFWRLRRRDLS
jgi:hypothetical protein